MQRCTRFLEPRERTKAVKTFTSVGSELNREKMIQQKRKEDEITDSGTLAKIDCPPQDRRLKDQRGQKVTRSVAWGQAETSRVPATDSGSILLP